MPTAHPFGARPWLPSARPDERIGRAVFYGIVAAAVTLWGSVLLARTPSPAFPTDDAYITLHNAAALIRGYDPNYGVSPLVGATSTVHLAAVALSGVFLDLPLASFVVSIGAALLYALGLARVAFQFALPLGSAALIVGSGLSLAYVPFHLFNGLETGLALAAATWALALAGERSRILLPLLCGVMPFIRPELGALSASLLAWRGWQAWTEERSRAATLTRLARDGAMALAAAAPWLAWSWLSTGHVLPLTVSAKRAFFASDLTLLSAAIVVLLCLSKSGVLIGLGLAGLARRAPLAPPIFAFMTIFIGAYLSSFPGGLSHNYFRYTYLLTPLALYAACFLAVTHRRLIQILAAACFAAIPFHWPAYDHEMSSFTPELAEVARWSRNNLPADARVLIHDAGYIAFDTKLAVIDMVGLKTPSSILEHQERTAASGGRKRLEAIHAIAARNRATHAIVLNDDDFWNGLAEDLRLKGWRLNPIRAPSARLGYVVYELSPPEGQRTARQHP